LSFDISRSTFNALNDYAGVVMEQGRVQSDADWNEWLAEIARRTQAGTLDILGRAVYPATTPFAFQITATTTGGTNSVSIGAGRMYVDGLLAENHGASQTWDPGLAELSGSPQPPPASNNNAIDFAAQPYYSLTVSDARLLESGGPMLVYLDVWTRPITYLQDSHLIDPAIAVDTSGRIQTVWQVKLLPVPASTTWTCQTADSEIDYPAPSAGQLTTGVVPNTASGPCCLTDDTGYTGLENQCYRVEIHNPGTGSDTPTLSGATFKWSRENASVMAGVTLIANGFNSLNQPASVLTVTSLGRDDVLGFLPGAWIEVLDEAHELNGEAGELFQIDTIDAASRTITLTGTLSNNFTVGTPTPQSCTRIVRWDQSGKVYHQDLTTVWWDLEASGGNGTIPVPLQDTTLVLEGGITVVFSISSTSTSPSPSFNTGDFWTFAARTADGSVESLTNAPPRGPHHHYAKLSIVAFNPSSNPDCRNEWPPSAQSDCGCCTYTVGVNGQGQYSSIQTAINALPSAGGEICLLPGLYSEAVVINGRSDVTIRGCGSQSRVLSPTPAPAGATESGLSAVITIADSEHVRLKSFCVEAEKDMVGILLDRAPPQEGLIETRVNVDVGITDMVVTASTLPAIVATHVDLFTIDDNRIAMQNVPGKNAALRLSGTQISVNRNWVGLWNQKDEPPWIPASVAGDLSSQEGDPSLIRAPGGIHIAGPADGIILRENVIEGGGGNGITLGDVVELDRNGDKVGGLQGVSITIPDECATSSTLGILHQVGSNSFVAGELLKNIRIERNTIRHTGLCGIGPIAFFDLGETQEAICIENLAILGNDIYRTLESPIADISGTDGIVYGAICLPDVQNLIIRDNVVTDFGIFPGDAGMYGIFILNAEFAEISRNQIRETRDWLQVTTAANQYKSYLRGGILVMVVTPPTFGGLESLAEWSSTSAMPISEPGLPALRIENNVVRVAVGGALEASGLGPFSIVNNHLGTGGDVSIGFKAEAMTVTIVNFGLSLELASTGLFSSLYQKLSTAQSQYSSLSNSGNGTVLFANNICQLEARASRQQGDTSVLVSSLDSVIFANNQCWVDADKPTSLAEVQVTAILDTLILASTVQVTANRFQEAVRSVLASGLTVGLANVTSLNLSTYCLFALGLPTVSVPAASSNNMSLANLFSASYCLDLQGKYWPRSVGKAANS
jgi:hypothetical protein